MCCGGVYFTLKSHFGIFEEVRVAACVVVWALEVWGDKRAAWFVFTMFGGEITISGRANFDNYVKVNA